MSSSLSIDLSETSTQVHQGKPLTLSRIVTHHFLSAKVRDPREEGFMDMLQHSVFPMYHVLSFVSVLCFVSVAGFVLQVVFGGVAGPEFLQPGVSFISDNFAAERIAVVRHKWFFQLFTCQFLSRDLISLIGNLFLLLLMVSWAEAMLTTGRAILSFILTVGCANAIVMLHLIPGVQVMGLSTGIYGLLGSALGCLILNWPNLYFMKFPRIIVFWMFALIIGFSMVYARTDVEVTCQLMGLMIGVLVGLFCSPTQRISDRETKDLSWVQKLVLVFGFLTYFVTLMVAILLMFLA